MLVEGRDDQEFLRHLCGYEDFYNIQIESYGGRNNLRNFIKALPALPKFEEVKRLGVIRDADDNVDGALSSVRGALSNAGLSAPGVRTDDLPQVSVLIMPPGQTSGCLESLLWEGIREESGADCVGDFLQCADIPSLGNRRVKASVHAYIATRNKPGLKIGEAAKAGYFDLDHPALESVKDFLKALAS